MGVVAAILIGLFLYFVPVVPYSFDVVCSSLNAFGCGPFTRESGLNSIAQSLSGSGATYSFQWGYDYGPGLSLGTYQYDVGATAGYTLNVYFGGLPVILLAACSVVGLLSPEIVDGSHLLSVVVREKLGRSATSDVANAKDNDS